VRRAILGLAQYARSNLASTQNQISSGLQFTTASQNPVAAGLVNAYNQALAQSQQIRHKLEQRPEQSLHRGHGTVAFQIHLIAAVA
jgi:hypothetical protein